jgi:hypothetical protein
MLRRWLLGTVAVAALASGLLARPGIVTHRDGSTYTGDVSEDEQGKVTVMVRHIPIVINRSDVVSIKYVDDEDFPKKLASLPPNDIKGRMDLAKWALGERKYDQAIQAAEAVLKIDPNNAEATEFINMVRRQREMDRNHPAPAAGTGTTAHTGAGSTTAPANEPRKTLTADDINLIRQAELSDKEDFRVQFNNDVRRKYCDANKINLAEFQSHPPTAQAREIIKAAPAMRNDVRITSDPASFTTYRQKVQPVMMQGCATAGCHSGQTGGSFVMVNTATDSEPTAYTNFYILTQYRQKVGKSNVGMIERTTPQKSLLLQYGLPPENADPKHPDVPNYRPIFRTPNDPRFQIIATWLGEQLTVPAPDYSSIKYDIPKNAAATPATNPSK